MSVPFDDFKLINTKMAVRDTKILSCLPEVKRLQPALEIGTIHQRMREIDRLIVIASAVGSEARRRKAVLRRRIRWLSVQ